MMALYGKLLGAGERLLSIGYGALSLECLLHNRVNGGALILARSVLVSAWIFLGAISFESWLRVEGPAHFDWREARIQIADKLPWLGAIFTGVYLSLYARFASQWNYLACLYNEIMAAAVSNPGAADSVAMVNWRAGFIEDAEDLHLATRPMFAHVIRSMLAMKGVADAYVRHTHKGIDRLTKLRQRIERVIGPECSPAVNGPAPTPLAASAPIPAVDAVTSPA